MRLTGAQKHAFSFHLKLKYTLFRPLVHHSLDILDPIAMHVHAIMHGGRTMTSRESCYETLECGMEV